MFDHVVDDERIWEGHASMIDEIKEQLKVRV
jgi:threonine dehydratase